MRICGGSGSIVYYYEGPQFGKQLVEETCERCNEWHEDQRPLPPTLHGPKISRLRRLYREVIKSKA